MEEILVGYAFGKICDIFINMSQKSIESNLREEGEKAFFEILKRIKEIDIVYLNESFFIELYKSGQKLESIYEILKEIYPTEEEIEIESKEQKIVKIINEVIINYPKLKDYIILDAIQKLHSKKDTKQILSYSEFIDEAIKNPLTTPINNRFLCDNEEEYIKCCIDNSIILFIGDPGVGKTKTAVEIGKRYSERENRSFKIISFKGIDLDIELIEKFKNEKIKYLVLFDDVNRSQEVFEKFLKLYAKRIEDGNIKIFLTVRNYARMTLKKSLDNFSYLEIDLSEENKKYIEKTLKEDYEIRNEYFIEQILFVSKKNYRLALMIGKVCLEDKNINGLRNTNKIYERYFLKVEEELEILKDEECSKLLLAISTYGTINIENESQKEELHRVFGIDLEVLEKTKLRLFEKEVIDIYLDKILKISDQVLSTYIFYNLFFKKRILSIENFIENIILRDIEKAKDIIYPIIGTFKNEELLDYFKTEVNNYLKKYKNKKKEKYILYKFLFFLYSDEILDEVCIFLTSEKKDEEIYIDEYILEYLELIKRYEDEKEIIRLYFLYLEKDPSKKEEIKKSLEENYTYKKESPDFNYTLEYNVVEILIKILKEKRDKKEIILSLLERFLEIEIRFVRQNLFDKENFSFSQYFIKECINIRKLRNLIFDYLKEIYQINTFKTEVLNILNNYIVSMRSVRKIDLKIIENDILKIENIFEIFFMKDLKERILINNYYNFLNDMEIELGKERLKKIVDEEIKFYTQSKKIIFSNEDISLEFFNSDNSFKLELKIIFQLLKYISNENRSYNSYIYSLEKQLYKENDCEKYLILINEVFLNNSLKIILNVKYMIEKFGEKRTYNLIINNNFKMKNYYLYNYYMNLNDDSLDQIKLESLLEIYRTSESIEIDYSFKIYKKLKYKYPNLIVNAINILLLRNNENYIKNLLLFNMYIYTPDEIIEAFESDLELLKRVYKSLYISDYSAIFLYAILEKDISFLREYISEIYVNNYNYITFDKIKLKPLYLKIFKKFLEIILEKDVFIIGNMTISLFFDFEKEKKIICDLILQNIDDGSKISKLFEIISCLDIEYKKYYYLYLIEKNVKVEILNEIDLFSRMKTGIGSLAPQINYEINEYKKIMLQLKDIKNRKYKIVLKKKIENLEYEKNFWLETEFSK